MTSGRRASSSSRSAVVKTPSVFRSHQELQAAIGVGGQIRSEATGFDHFRRLEQWALIDIPSTSVQRITADEFHCSKKEQSSEPDFVEFGDEDAGRGGFLWMR